MKVVQLTESGLNSLIENIIQEQRALNEDAVLFRKMTPKSVFNFGRFKGHTVDDLLRIGNVTYLREIYFNIEGITFTDDILEAIGIYNEWDDFRIEKPGKDRELGQKVNDLKLTRSSPLRQKQMQKRKVGKLVQHLKTDKSTFSRKNLQRWNQGHK